MGFFVVSGVNGCQAWLSAGMSRARVCIDTLRKERQGRPGMTIYFLVSLRNVKIMYIAQQRLSFYHRLREEIDSRQKITPAPHGPGINHIQENLRRDEPPQKKYGKQLFPGTYGKR